MPQGDRTTTTVAATDEQLRAGVLAADVITLLPAVAHLTGDLSVLRDDLRPDPLLLMQPDAGFTDAQLADARSLAFDALVRHRDGGAPPAPDPAPDALHAMIEFLVGPATDEWYAVLREELALSGADHRAPGWSKDRLAPDVAVARWPSSARACPASSPPTACGRPAST